MKRTSPRPLLLVLLSIAWIVACVPGRQAALPTPAGDGWPVAHPAEVGLDEGPFREAIEGIRDGTYPNVHSLLVVKDGKLVVEAYFPGYTWDYNGDQFLGDYVEFEAGTPHNLASVTKSFTSALVGIAIDRGFIRGVDEKLFSFFPEYAELSDGTKAGITLEDLLTMRSGLAWNEMELPYSDTRNDLVQLFLVPDPLAYILAKPPVSEPGTRWYYSGGNTNLLGEIIRQTTGQRMDAFAAETLFGPLDITDYAWDFINPDMIHASGNLKLRPRDMAKLGSLYLNGGLWNGERIVSQAWVEASTRPHTPAQGGTSYGYQWWLRTYRVGAEAVECFYAAGWGGQMILVFPDLQMVVVLTGGNYVGGSPVDEIVTRHILPAAR
jgi:CubicO group peptidase (beta-lactamase class C family)